MGIKTILTLLAVGGLAGSVYYYRDGVQSAFATGKEKAVDVKDTLKEGHGGKTENVLDTIPDNHGNNFKDGGSGKGNNGKNSNVQIVYVPLYNEGQQSSLSEEQKSTVEYDQNPVIEEFIKKDKKKTKRVVNTGFSVSSSNIKSYEKKKFGIDYDVLKSGAAKNPSKRTIDERKQIEAEKGRSIFDSRSISNW